MRAMRLIVMFDLPMGNAEERKSYVDFRKFLVEDGYEMDQFSVYTRTLLTRESIGAHIGGLEANLPLAGVVTAFEMTEKQYANRWQLLNTRRPTVTEDERAQLTFVL